MFQSTYFLGFALAISLFAGINAQSSEDVLRFSIVRSSTTTRDSLASETSSIPVETPTGTGQPCAKIAAAAKRHSSQYKVAVPAKVAYDCLTSVPVKRTAALGTIEAVERMAQFQSNLAYLKNPPKDYVNPSVDIMGGLADIRNKVSQNQYRNQYDFEADIGSLLNSARDGHLGFDGPTFVGAVRWRRGAATLVSASLDGGLARIYDRGDLNKTSSPSPVSQINGEDVNAFLQNEADMLTYHDPDTRWNALFYHPPAQTLGFFVSPQLYPGPTTTIKYENGTEQTYNNRAVLQEEISWPLVADGDSFYSVFVDPSSGRKLGRELTMKTAPRVPNRLQLVHEKLDDGNGEIPTNYPEPYITGPDNVYINGYFLNHPNISNLAVLALQTFDTDTRADAAKFQSLTQRFLDEAKSRRSEKIIIDLQSNPGGRVLLGYETFLQFFPNIEPFGGSRFRVHDSVNIMGTELSRLSFSPNGIGFTSSFNYHSYLTDSNNPFNSWTDLYNGPTSNGDNFTKLIRHNLTDSDGLVMTGTSDRSNRTTPPFLPNDIILLTDGNCGSTCSLFVEFMTIQAGVKVVVLGGRPQDGPMQPVGATKGSRVLTAEYLNTFAEYVLTDFASSTSERRNWASILPRPFPIRVAQATVNFLDNIRQGDEGMTPTQFTNETANCRLWYTREMALDVTEVWLKVADAAWGGVDGGIDEAKCVPGSYRKASLLEEPPASTVGSEGADTRNKGAMGAEGGRTGAAAKSLDGGWAVALAVGLAFGLGVAVS